MKQFLFALMALGLCLGIARAEENVQAAQTQLKKEGFYFGELTGVYDSETSAAVTRYQIRHGLAISGRLDAATAQALGVTAPKNAAAEPSPVSDTWRSLRDGDVQFLKQLNSGAIPPPKAPIYSSPAPPPSAVAASRPVAKPYPATAPLAQKAKKELPPRATSAPPASNVDYGTERLRDYVGAFILAGLDPKVGAELEFFADRVDYFGQHNMDRERIRRDLVRYDKQWPQRRFWLAGEVGVEGTPGGELAVTFPLRYQLRSKSKHAAGKVTKRLTLRKTGHGDLQIVAVNEASVKNKR